MKISNKKISVIVPVYNVELYVEECIRSIIAQTYDNLEIIVIDDGSTDESGKICDDIALEDKRITVYHKNNGGLYSARNYGLDKAKGDYISFVDSDDTIDPEMLNILIQLLEEHNADVSIIDHKVLGTNKETTEPNQKTTRVINRSEFLTELALESGKTPIAVWHRLYKKSVVNGLKFPVGKCFEDVVWNVEMADRCNFVVYYKKPLYNYRISNGGITCSNINGVQLGEKFITENLSEHKRQYELLEKVGETEIASISKWRYLAFVYNTIHLLSYSCNKHLNVYKPLLLKEININRSWMKEHRHINKKYNIERNYYLPIIIYVMKRRLTIKSMIESLCLAKKRCLNKA